MLVHEEHLQPLLKVIPLITFLEVQGMDVAGMPLVKLLTTPLQTPIAVSQPMQPQAAPTPDPVAAAEAASEAAQDAHAPLAA